MSVAPGQIRIEETAPRRRRLPDLGVRAASGFCLIFVALGATLAGGILFLFAWLFAACAVLFEWQRLVGGRAPATRHLIGIAGLVGVGVLAHRANFGGLLLLLALVAAFAALAGPGRRLWAASGMAYAGLFVLAIVSLRFSHPDGARALIWLFALVWASDVFAYFGGRLLGGPKLWPRISPSKTWSGTASGLAAGALVGSFVALRDRFAWDHVVPLLSLTLAAAIVSQAGDAFESAIKRHFGVKDTSRLIPGHGGVMDRLDGFIAAAIFAYLFGLTRGLDSVAAGLFAWR